MDYSINQIWEAFTKFGRGVKGLGFSGVPIIWTIVSWGLYWGPPILGNYHFSFLILSNLLKLSASDQAR